jgi:MerR family redox-sensitive transcriptional activator SoxR
MAHVVIEPLEVDFKSSHHLTMTIGEVANRSGTPASTIRYYERIGLLPKARRESGRRVFGADAVRRLGLIRVATSAGFTLEQTRLLLAAMDGKGRATREMQRLAATKVPELEEALARTELLLRLMRSATRCRCPSLDRCAELAVEHGVLADVS